MSGAFGKSGRFERSQPGLLVLFGLLFRRRQALEALQKLFLGHALDRDLVSSASTLAPAEADQRHGIRFWLVDLDEFLQGMNQFLTQIFRRNRGVGDFPQRYDRILVVIAINREL